MCAISAVAELLVLKLRPYGEREMRDEISARHAAGEAEVVFGGVCLSVCLSLCVCLCLCICICLSVQKMRNYRSEIDVLVGICVLW